MIQASYHTHNRYCDGAGSIEDVVEAAIAANLTEIGISSHAPLPFPCEWTMPENRLDEYLREVRETQDRYRDRITVLLGAELDFIADPRVADFQRDRVLDIDFDYCIGSVHFLGRAYPPLTVDSTEQQFQEILRNDYGNNIQAMVEEYFRRMRQMLAIPPIKIVGHMDRIKRWNEGGTYFREDEPWYVAALDETLGAIAASGQLVELNTGAWRNGLSEPYPSLWILAGCRDRGIPVTVSSDAHTPADVTAGFDRAAACLAELGITSRTLW